MHKPLLSALLAFGALTLPGSAQGTECSSWGGPETIFAGQTIPVGTWQVSNDDQNVYIDINLNTGADCTGADRNATFAQVDDNGDPITEQIKFWIGDNLANLPSNMAGNPVIGQFPFKVTVSDPTTTSIRVSASIDDISLVFGWGSGTPGGFSQICGLELFVVLHLDLDVDGDCDPTTGPDKETAFGGPNDGNTGTRWWYWASYEVCCDNPPPPQMNCETAFAKGGWVFASNKRANPEKLPSLKLNRMRWGWAIELTATGQTEYDIWAGAGRNDTSNGWLVGKLYVDWDGTNVTVTYSLNSPYAMTELHVWADDAVPNTIAPGQYGYAEYFNPPVSMDVVTAPLADTNGDGSVWLIAHSVVCVTP